MLLEVTKHYKEFVLDELKYGDIIHLQFLHRDFLDEIYKYGLTGSHTYDQSACDKTIDYIRRYISAGILRMELGAMEIRKVKEEEKDKYFGHEYHTYMPAAIQFSSLEESLEFLRNEWKKFSTNKEYLESFELCTLFYMTDKVKKKLRSPFSWWYLLLDRLGIKSIGE